MVKVEHRVKEREEHGISLERVAEGGASQASELSWRRHREFLPEFQRSSRGVPLSLVGHNTSQRVPEFAGGLSTVERCENRGRATGEEKDRESAVINMSSPSNKHLFPESSQRGRVQ